MIRAVAAIAIVAIIAMTVLVIWRREVRRSELRTLRNLINDIATEAAAQLAAGNPTHGYTLDLIRQYDRQELLK